jgi:hypothetical protein
VRDGLVAVRVGEDRGELPVDVKAGMRLTRGQDAGQRAKHPGGEGDRVDAEVEQGATGQVAAQDAVPGGEVLADVGHDGADPAENA